MKTTVAILMIIMGTGIGAVWTRDITTGEKVDLSNGFFRAREDGDGSLFWPHWIAEYGTAAALVAGALGLLAATKWGPPLAAIALGALFYTSVNSLGWAFARPDRSAYTIPMIAGIVVSLVGAGYLLVG